MDNASWYHGHERHNNLDLLREFRTNCQTLLRTWFMLHYRVLLSLLICLLFCRRQKVIPTQNGLPQCFPERLPLRAVEKFESTVSASQSTWPSFTLPFKFFAAVFHSGASFLQWPHLHPTTLSRMNILHKYPETADQNHERCTSYGRKEISN
jgi:hypothetical protein